MIYNKILLVIPQTVYSSLYNYEKFQYTPLESITRISNVLIENGYSVNILDLRKTFIGYKEIKDIIIEYDVIGFTSFYDSFTFFEKLFLKFKYCKNKPLFVLGGPLCTSIYYILKNYQQIDYVICGEGEYTFLGLLNELNGFENEISKYVLSIEKSKILFSKEININKLPLLDWNLYQNLRRKKFNIGYIASRGCKNNCTYCCFNNVSYRYFSINRFKSEIEYLVKNWNLKKLILNDANFFNHPFFYEYIDILNSNDIKWGCFLRPEKISLKKLRDAKSKGCRNIRIGIESINNKILQISKRNITASEIKKAIKKILDVGIEKITGYFIFGLPGESKESINKTFNFIINNTELMPRIFSIIVLPGSKLYRYCIRNGIIEDEIIYLRNLSYIKMETDDPILLNLTNLSNSEFIRLREKMINLSVEQELSGRKTWTISI